MFYVYLLAIAYVAVNAALWYRMNQLFQYVFGLPTIHDKEHKVIYMITISIYTLVHLFLMTSVISWTLFDDEDIIHILKYICNVWVGVFIYTIFFMIFAEIITFLRWLWKAAKRRKSGKRKQNRKYVSKKEHRANKLFIIHRTAVIAVLVVAFSLFGIFHSDQLTTRSYDVTIDKDASVSHLKIALIADTHLGYSVGNEQMQKMAAAINAEDVDLVCFAGDIVDNEFYAIYEPDEIIQTFSGIKSKYGVYAVYGNHDVQEKLIGGFTLFKQDTNKVQPQVDQMMKDSGITVLQDQTVTIADDIQLIGRIDEEKPNENYISSGERKTISQLTKSLNPKNVIIDIDHEPKELSAKSAAGVDLDLCGHTHNGQIFPGNILMKFIWENPYGLKKYGNMYSIVTSGVGVWGPAMRVGTNAEVVFINVTFEGDQ